MQVCHCSQVKLYSSSTFLSRNLIKKSTCWVKCFQLPTLLIVLCDKDNEIVGFNLTPPVSKTTTCKVSNTNRISRNLNENSKKIELIRDICCVPSPISSSHNIWICLLSKSCIEIYDYNPLSMEKVRLLSTYNIDNTFIINPVEIFIIDSTIYQQRNLLILDSKGHGYQKCIWSAKKKKDQSTDSDFLFSVKDKVNLNYSISNFEMKKNDEIEAACSFENGIIIDKSLQILKSISVSNLIKNSFDTKTEKLSSSLVDNSIPTAAPVSLLSSSSASLTAADINLTSDFVFVLKSPASSTSAANKSSSSSSSVNLSVNSSRSVILDKRYLKVGSGFEHILIGKSLSEALSVPTESEIRLFETIQTTNSSFITPSSSSVNEEIPLIRPVGISNSSGSTDTQFIQSLYSIRSSSFPSEVEGKKTLVHAVEKEMSDSHGALGIIHVYCESSITENDTDCRTNANNLNEELLSKLSSSSTSNLVQELKELSLSYPKRSDDLSQYCTISLLPSSLLSPTIPCYDIFTTFSLSSTEFLIAASHTTPVNQTVIVYSLNLQKSNNQIISPVHSFSYSSSHEVSFY
jgi:hypothetical protein